MIGISGGGWTTTLYAAIDDRISKSFSVAGSLPISLRIESRDIGDYEQTHREFYSIANYLELYVMCSYGENRMQMHIFNKLDPCCFSGDLSMNYENIIKTPNTLNSHRILKWAEKESKQEEALELLFYSYFTEGRDIGNNDELVRIAKKLGLNSKKIEKDLDSDIDVKEIELEEWSYRDLGIAGVPTYILENNMIITGSQSSETFVNVFNKINSRKTE